MTSLDPILPSSALLGFPSDSNENQEASGVPHLLDSFHPTEIMSTLAEYNKIALIPTTLPRGQKWPHESNHSDSDKESTHVLDLQHSGLISKPSSFVTSAHAKVNSARWIDVRKKKGKKEPTTSTQ